MADQERTTKILEPDDPMYLELWRRRNSHLPNIKLLTDLGVVAGRQRGACTLFKPIEVLVATPIRLERFSLGGEVEQLQPKS